jgi:sarcosine oxidase subunit beta
MNGPIHADLVVIGGGIHGCSAALHASRKGMKTVVIEKDTVGRHASGVNAGGVRRLRRHFAEVPIAVRSMQIWHGIADLLDDDCGFRIAPHIEVAESEQEMERLRQRQRALADMGYSHERILDGDAMRRHIPLVSGHCVGALASLEDGFAQPYRSTFAFYRKAHKEGAAFFENTRVIGVHSEKAAWIVRTDRQTFVGDRLLNCAGAWGGRVAAWLGEPVPVEPFAPMMIVTDRLPHFCDAVVLLANRPFSFKQMSNGCVVIGGGRRGIPDIDSNGSTVRFPRLCLTAATAIDIFPHMRGATIIRAWAGLDGHTPDGIPIIGSSSTRENVYHAFGFCGHGFQLGPAVGEAMAKLMTGGHPRFSLVPFAIGRFRKAEGES